MSEPVVRMEVWFSEEQAAIIHAARKKHGVWMSVAEARLRDQAEAMGLEIPPRPIAAA